MPGTLHFEILSGILVISARLWKKPSEIVLFPFTGTQTVTPIEGAELSAPSSFFMLPFIQIVERFLSAASSDRELFVLTIFKQNAFRQFLIYSSNIAIKDCLSIVFSFCQAKI